MRRDVDQLLITIGALIAMEILAPVAGALVVIRDLVLLELCHQVLEREGLRLRDPGAGHLELPIIIVDVGHREVVPNVMQPVGRVVVLGHPLDARLGVEGVCGAMQQVGVPIGIIRVRVCELKVLASAFVQAANPEALHKGQAVTAVVLGKDVEERHQVHPCGHEPRAGGPSHQGGRE